METIEQTVQMFLNEMHRVGYGTDRLSTAASVLKRLCAYHSAVNRLHLDRKLSEKYVDALREKLNGDPTGQRYAQREILNIRIFLGFVDTGKIIDPSLLPPLRPYDFRHTFALTVLQKWINEGVDLFTMLPYLRTYMGHEHFEETAYYIHILPERLSASPGVNWDAIDAAAPEVSIWG